MKNSKGTEGAEETEDKMTFKPVRSLVWLILLSIAATAQILNLAELNTDEIKKLDRAKTVVIIPGGILEEHGPYLPSGSDSYQSEWLSRKLAERIVARPGWTVLMFPQIPLGSGGANVIGGKYSFPGSYTVRNSTLRAIYMDLADSLGQQGFRWIFLVHNHGYPGQNAALDQAGDYFHDVYGGRMVHLFGLMPVRQQGSELLKELTEPQRTEEGFSVHGGFDETSDVLFVRPDVVNPEYRNAPPFTGAHFGDLVAIAKKENWTGYFGSPRLATAALGARDMTRTAEALAGFALRILDGFDPHEVLRYAQVLRQDPSVLAVDQAALANDAALEKKQQEWLRKNGR